MEILSSRLLAAFKHGFTTRLGGVSRPPYESLNLGGSVGDDPAHVAANWTRLRAATGLGFARVKQVHGCQVVRADRAHEPEEEADIVVTSSPGVAACVSVADCVPVLLADPRTGAVAAIHAGWRGTLARAAAVAVAALARDFGARPGDLLAAVGPSIGPCCYDVSADLAEQFRLEFGPTVAEARAVGSRLDLWLANELTLLGVGLERARVEVLRRCTSCETDLLFSHRRGEGKTGRQVGFIAPRSAGLS
jgi:YfiH family protein